MAAELEVPTDSLGLPYLIAPRDFWLPLDNSDVANRHHGFHPHDDPIFATVGGRALRSSMIQVAEVELHNRGKGGFHEFYWGLNLDFSQHQLLRRIFALMAGCVPEGVVDLSSGEPIERLMRPNERAYFKTPSPTDPFGYRYLRYGYGQIRDFLADVVTSQNLSHLNYIRIEKFLTVEDVEEKKKIGRMLLKNAIGVASDPVREDYFALRKAGRLHPGMPPEPQQLMLYKLGNTERLDSFIPQLEDRLLHAA